MYIVIIALLTDGGDQITDERHSWRRFVMLHARQDAEHDLGVRWR